MSELISHIKVNNNKTEIVLKREEIHDQSKLTIERIFTSDELRHPDFDAAAIRVVPIISKLLNFPKEYEVELKNVAIDRDDGFAATLGLWVKTGKDFTGCNWPSPKLISEGVGATNKMPQQLYEALVNLITEANEFAIKHKRAQTSLLTEKTDEELDAEEAHKIAPIRGKRRHA